MQSNLVKCVQMHDEKIKVTGRFKDKIGLCFSRLKEHVNDRYEINSKYKSLINKQISIFQRDIELKERRLGMEEKPSEERGIGGHNSCLQQYYSSSDDGSNFKSPMCEVMSENTAEMNRKIKEKVDTNTTNIPSDKMQQLEIQMVKIREEYESGEREKDNSLATMYEQNERLKKEIERIKEEYKNTEKNKDEHINFALEGNKALQNDISRIKDEYKVSERDKNDHTNNVLEHNKALQNDISKIKDEYKGSENNYTTSVLEHDKALQNDITRFKEEYENSEKDENQYSNSTQEQNQRVAKEAVKLTMNKNQYANSMNNQDQKMNCDIASIKKEYEDREKDKINSLTNKHKYNESIQINFKKLAFNTLSLTEELLNKSQAEIRQSTTDQHNKLIESVHLDLNNERQGLENAQSQLHSEREIHKREPELYKHKSHILRHFLNFEKCITRSKEKIIDNVLSEIQFVLHQGCLEDDIRFLEKLNKQIKDIEKFDTPRFFKIGVHMEIAKKYVNDIIYLKRKALVKKYYSLN